MSGRDRTLTGETVRDLLNYDPETGKLYWRHRDRSWFGSDGHYKGWNKQFAGKEALIVNHRMGYKSGGIFGTVVYAHRIIWLWMTGEHPSNDIDHINGDRHDNRWCNLRSVTRAENLKNRSKSSKNKSGHIGVHWSTCKGHWVAQIKINGRQKYLGGFCDLKDAVRARKKAERELGFHPNHGRKFKPIAC